MVFPIFNKTSSLVEFALVTAVLANLSHCRAVSLAVIVKGIAYKSQNSI